MRVSQSRNRRRRLVIHSKVRSTKTAAPTIGTARQARWPFSTSLDTVFSYGNFWRRVRSTAFAPALSKTFAGITLSGYKEIFVPFQNSNPAGPSRDLLWGFLSADEKVCCGRPTGVTVGPDKRSLPMADYDGDVFRRMTGAR
jgi:hypothetical protein